MASKLEFLFKWTCPSCGHHQGDSVNPDLGPFLTLTCGECIGTFEDSQLFARDVEAWEGARTKAEAVQAVP